MSSPYTTSSELINAFRIKLNNFFNEELKEADSPAVTIKPSGVNPAAASEQFLKDARAGVYGQITEEFYNAKS